MFTYTNGDEELVDVDASISVEIKNRHEGLKNHRKLANLFKDARHKRGIAFC